MLLLHSVRNIVAARTAVVRILRKRAVGVVDSFLQGPAPIAVVLASVGRRDLLVDFDTVRTIVLKVVVVRVDLDHIEVVERFVEVGLELGCFVVGVGLAVGAVGKTIGVKGIVEVRIVMADPVGVVGVVAAGEVGVVAAGEVGVVAAGEVGLVVGEAVVMAWVLVLEGIAVGV